MKVPAIKNKSTKCDCDVELVTAQLYVTVSCVCEAATSLLNVGIVFSVVR